MNKAESKHNVLGDRAGSIHNGAEDKRVRLDSSPTLNQLLATDNENKKSQQP